MARTVNPEGLDFYDRLVDGMLERGLKPFQTLYHWELPSALADLGGWTNRDVAHWFADYAEAITRRIGDRVASIATINEPWCVAWLSHFIGVHAPGHRDIRAAARAMHHVLLAHGTAVERLRGMGQQNLGIVLNFDHTDPASDSPRRCRPPPTCGTASSTAGSSKASPRQTYPEQVLTGLAPHMPDNWQDDMALIGQPIDWLGVNYYTRHTVADAPGTPWPAIRDVPGDLPKTQMGWEIYPAGPRTLPDPHGTATMSATCRSMSPKTAWPMPTTLDDGTVTDEIREDYLFDHLAATKLAIAKGANVKGFFYWSLLDNYEWAEGYEKRFGLVHVDFETLVRTPKSSYHALARALARND